MKLNQMALAVLALWAGTATAQVVATPPSVPKVAGDAYWGGLGSAPSTAQSDDEGAQFRAPIPTSVNGVLSDEVFRRGADAASKVPFARAQAIQEAAAAYGAQAGMASRARQINDSIVANSASYDRVFNFSALMLEPGFLPPVISEARDAYNQPSDLQVRAADRIYKIEFPARLVNAAPRWQEYLDVPVSAPLVPDRTAMPKNAAEKALWDEWARRGWEQGQAQADEAFKSNLARLRRDFEGMLRFKTLYEQGVVSKPKLSKQYLGVTGGDDELAVGDRVYTVTDRSRFNPDSARWSQSVPVTAPQDRIVKADPRFAGANPSTVPQPFVSPGLVSQVPAVPDIVFSSGSPATPAPVRSPVPSTVYVPYPSGGYPSQAPSPYYPQSPGVQYVPPPQLNQGGRPPVQSIIPPSP